MLSSKTVSFKRELPGSEDSVLLNVGCRVHNVAFQHLSLLIIE